MRRVQGLAIEGWSPEYGTPVEGDQDEVPAAQVDASVEMPEAEWSPVGPVEDVWTPAHIDFVDGVRRIDARVWITGADGEARLGLCASFAGGVVRCERKAVIRALRVGRGFFGLSGVPDLHTPGGIFRSCPVAEDDIQQLINGVQERMGQLEVEVAAADGTDGLVVLDGPLRGRQRIPGAIGYIKSHRVQYLAAGPREIVARLAPGQRTPLFLIQTKWTRYSWYLRLSDAMGHPWAGIVRCEAWTETGLDRAQEMADATAAALPRFASEPHKDDRAPQNLYPIAGLERELRRRLGDPGVIYRGLQRAVAAYRPLG